MNEIEEARQLTEELTRDLESGFTEAECQGVYPTRPAYGGAAASNEQRSFAAQIKRKLADRNQRVREYFIRKNEEHKLKLFPLLTLEALPFCDYNTTAAELIQCLERERTVLIRELNDMRTRSAPLKSPLGTELLRVREQKGHSQEEAAEEIGCDASSISRIERGKAAPKRLRKNVQKYLTSGITGNEAP